MAARESIRSAGASTTNADGAVRSREHHGDAMAAAAFAAPAAAGAASSSASATPVAAGTAVRASALPDGADRHEIRIAHVQQRRAWDCGIACVEMLLRAAYPAGVPQPISQYDDSDDEAGGNGARLARGDADLWDDLADGVRNGSVWTVDLAVRLAERGMPHVYHTTMAGVNPAHAELSFYSGFDDDAERLPAIFERARRLGVTINEVRD